MKHQEEDNFAEEMLAMMMAQYGDAAEAYWFYEHALCPCCQTNPIDFMTYEGKKTLSINGFMYRARGVLIGYLLCGPCATSIMVLAKLGPKTTKKHQAIEATLIDAYEKYINSLDA